MGQRCRLPHLRGRLADGLADPLLAGGLFAWLLGVIIWLAFGVVHEAEELAEMLGEPFGTLILTLAIVIIEVALISAVMLGAKEAPALGRDTMYAVLMIVLNGVVGLGLLVGGLRHREQSYNLQGAAAYLGVMIPLSVIALVLPNFTTSTTDGSLTPVQAGFFSLFTILLYGIFLWLQTGRHSGFFIDPAEAAAPAAKAQPRKAGAVLPHVALLLANILPIVILAKSLAGVLDFGIHAMGAPPALGGVLIAMVVFTPEGLSALRAVAANQLQRAVNLCLGAAGLDARADGAGGADDRAADRADRGAGPVGDQHGAAGDDADPERPHLLRPAHHHAGRRGAPDAVRRVLRADLQPVTRCRGRRIVPPAAEFGFTPRLQTLVMTISP